MPSLCAAAGSFHVKSATTYFVVVLVTVRVLPFFVTVTLIFSVTVFVSTLAVRSYSDQRYSSMQVWTSRQSLGLSTGCTAGLGYSFTGSEGDSDASWRRVSGRSASGTASAAEKAASGTAGSGSLRWKPFTATGAVVTASGASTDLVAAIK